jgi:hypothetical protein
MQAEGWRDGGVEGVQKHQTPNTKLQKNTKHQAPNQNDLLADLKVGI